MRALCEVKWEKEEQPIDEETVYEKGQYYLLHWGSTFRIIELGNGTIAVASYTVGICENCKTGDVEMFLPDQIRITGQEIKKL